MEDIKEEIINYISKRKFLTLATTTQKGEPLTHPIAYVNKGATLYFSTGNSTRKFKNIQENPNVAYSVFEPTEHLEEVISVQMEGKATEVNDVKVIKEINKMLERKFPSMAELTKDPDGVIIKISPKICYFIDYTKGFGYRDKVKF